MYANMQQGPGSLTGAKPGQAGCQAPRIASCTQHMKASLPSTPMSTRSDECVPYESSLLGGCRVYDVLGSCQLTLARCY